MIGLICFLLLVLGGVANAQIVTPLLAPPNIVQTGGVPNGGPPQIIGYSAANTPENETVVGDMTFARTGSSQYTATVTSIGGVPFGPLATLSAGAGLTASASTLSLTVPVAIVNGGTGTSTAPSTTGQIEISQSPTALAPRTVSGDATLSSTGALTVTKLNGTTPGGACTGNQVVTSISSAGVPTCSTPAGVGVPSGTAPQFLGYSAAGAAEVETLGGGTGACTFSRTGAGAYALNCSYVSSNNPTFTGTVTMPDGSTWNGSGLTGATGSFVNLSTTNLSVANINITSGTGGINLPIGGIYYQPGYNLPSLPAFWDQHGIQKMEAIGIGQAIGADPLDITDNVNGPANITVLNNSTGTGAYAALNLTNGTNTARFQLGGTAFATTGGQSANNLTVYADQGIAYSSHNSLPQQFLVNNTVQATIATNGLHLSSPLEVASGGTGSTTAPTQNQILVAQSGSAYAPVAMSGDATVTSTGAVSVGTTGTWLPDVQFGSQKVGVSYSMQQGNWLRIGKYYFVSFGFLLTSKGTSTGPVILCGLPDTGSTSTNTSAQGLFPVAIYQGMSGFTNTNTVSLMLNNNSNCISLVSQTTATGVILQVTNTNVANNLWMDGNFWYVGN